MKKLTRTTRIRWLMVFFYDGLYFEPLKPIKMIMLVDKFKVNNIPGSQDFRCLS